MRYKFVCWEEQKVSVLSCRSSKSITATQFSLSSALTTMYTIAISDSVARLAVE